MPIVPYEIPFDTAQIKDLLLPGLASWPRVHVLLVSKGSSILVPRLPPEVRLALIPIPLVSVWPMRPLEIRATLCGIIIPWSLIRVILVVVAIRVEIVVILGVIPLESLWAVLLPSLEVSLRSIKWRLARRLVSLPEMWVAMTVVVDIA